MKKSVTKIYVAAAALAVVCSLQISGAEQAGESTLEAQPPKNKPVIKTQPEAISRNSALEKLNRSPEEEKPASSNTLPVSSGAVGAGAIQEMRRQLAVKDREIRALKERLASANADSERAQAELKDRQLRDEALGIEALTGDEERLGHRLATAVSDLYATVMERDQLREQLMKLCSQVELLLQRTPQMEQAAWDQLNADLKASQTLLAEGVINQGQKQPTLTEGKVQEMDPQLGLVIVNLGWKQGVKSGMNFEVIRENRLVARIEIVDVRDRYSAAIIKEDRKDLTTQPGDEVRVKISSTR